MNIYEKMNKAKLALQSAGLKKTGKNDFAKYSYFELGDFLPTIIGLESELKFCCQISFDLEEATLTITDAEKPSDQLLFASPMSAASLKGMHDVQNLGAVQTYLRRYLYVNAFEIVEHDQIDGKKESAPVTKQKTQQLEEKKQASQPGVLTAEQRNTIGETCKQHQVTVERLRDILNLLGHEGKTLGEIPSAEFNRIIDQIT